MSSTTKGFAIRDVDFAKAFGEKAQVVVNPGKVLPASTTGNLFAVTGSVVVTGLVGIVSTIFSATAVSPTLGVTNLPAAIAAAPSVAYASTAVGSVITMPGPLGGALPAVITAQTVAAAAAEFEVTAANITITTAATNTGAVTWILYYVPLQPKRGASVSAV